MRDTEREAETQAGGEAGSMQGARCGTRSWVSRIMPWAEGSPGSCPNHSTGMFIRGSSFISSLTAGRLPGEDQAKSYLMLLREQVVFLRFYLFIHERHREREAETQAGGGAGSTQGARCGTGSQDLSPRQTLNH